ncbi:MAG: lytic transglycosylase domain-containing protein [Ruminococcaceae bacterium]|nr:lytic transglycosylase domain-containing protein [Oscillospiraceae bacterium]
MKHKNAVRRSAVILSILALSVLIGFLYQFIWDRIDRSNYPREYNKFVERYSEEYGVPEYIIYSTIKVESNFNSSAESSAGAIGLMQLMPETFKYLMAEMKEDYKADLIYGPETNIRYGTYYLSKLYLKYGKWDTVFAAYNGGETNVDGWLKDKEYSSDGRTLENIPFKETEKYVAKMNRAIEVYMRLYY